MKIDALQTENNVYREVITKLKCFITDCDAQIQRNEMEIGRHLEEMRHLHGSANESECTLCLGECDGNV